MKICRRLHRLDYDWASLMQAYRRYVRSDDTVLEIGASQVERTREIGRKCGRVIGVELVAERIPSASGNVSYIHGDWQQLSDLLEPSSIDIAVASHVIEHVPDDLLAINELYRVLKKGGVALLNTPNRKRLSRAVIEIFTGERKFPWWEHLREYTREDLQDLLERASFERYEIIPVVFGIHGGPLFVYIKNVPRRFSRYANYLEAHLFKDSD